MKKSKIIKIILILILLLISSFMFFSFPTMVMPDSTEYYGYLKIFYGQETFSNWNIVRGPTFPFILFIITLLFSNSITGLIIGQYLFYLLTIFGGIFILNKISYKNKVIKTIVYMLYTITIALNPILIGYMHRIINRIYNNTIIGIKFINISKMD